MKTTKISSLILACALVMSCAKENGSDESKPFEPFVATKSQSTLINGYNSFAFNLTKSVTKHYPGESTLLISPYSMYNALVMLANGAQNNTYDQIAKALSFNGISAEDAGGFCMKYSDFLSQVDNLSLFKSSNALFNRDQMQINSLYKETLTKYFDAHIQSMDFSSESARSQINDWVSRATNGMIKEIPVDMSQIAIVNAICFEGKWSEPFDKKYTLKDNFKNFDNTTTVVDMMTNSSSKGFYATQDNTELYALPYGNGAFHFGILRTISEDGTTDMVLNALDADKWQNLLKSGRERSLTTLKLPKFNLTSPKIDFIPVAKELGIEDAFNNQSADLDKISSTRIFVSDLVQNCVVQIDEGGTKAASTSTVSLAPSSPGNDTFIVDRPFVFVIYEKSTQNILFVGKVDKL